MNRNVLKTITILAAMFAILIMSDNLTAQRREVRGLAVTKGHVRVIISRVEYRVDNFEKISTGRSIEAI